ncbi:four helix bundle protein [Clostridium sp. JS66]|uniref:four helix bundle protein n=1 Tax=Clostridium sp. JS66 TaxID=3064705 RepID=UPI00298DBE20|nr:four helix bundle protein [Clostridium sp. JS66]WPC42806.1 four helix bundle protein [Clostridium sp. JS66]
MNTYDKIYFEDFRKKYAYEKAVNLIEKVSGIIGVCDTKEKANILKNTTKVATEIALAIGSILSVERKDFHYKVAIGQTYSLSKLLAETQYEDFKGCNSIIEEIIKLLRTYRKQLRERKNIKMKKVEVGDKLDINKIQEMVDGLKDSRTLKAYEKMIIFYTRLFAVLERLPFYEQYSVFSQTQRAAESIMANLAEGNARQPYKLVVANFYSIALASAVEVQAWLDIMKIKKYISEEEHRILDYMLEEIKKLIIVYIKRVAVA